MANSAIVTFFGVSENVLANSKDVAESKSPFFRGCLFVHTDYGRKTPQSGCIGYPFCGQNKKQLIKWVFNVFFGDLL